MIRTACMAQLTVHIFGVFAILALGWVLFCLWLISLIFRFIWRGFVWLTGLPARPTISTKPRQCTRLRCLIVNPPQANFCRRCGTSLTGYAVQPQTSKSGSTAQWASSPGPS